MADNTRRPEQVPTENTDWFNYGGVYRDVELIFTPEVFIKNFNVSLVNDNKFKNIQAKVELSESVEGIVCLKIEELGVEKEIKISGGKESLILN